MAYKVKKPCRVCGNMYTPCADCENDNSIFHWRTVACSYECGMEYFKRIMESRSRKTEPCETASLYDVKEIKPDNEKIVKSTRKSNKKEIL